MKMRKVYKIMLLAVLLSVALFCLTGAYRAADQIQTAYAPYSFRYKEAFSSDQIQSAHRFQAGEDGTQYAMTLWNETKEVLKTDLHSIDAQVVFYSGDAAIVFLPFIYRNQHRVLSM